MSWFYPLLVAIFGLPVLIGVTSQLFLLIAAVTARRSAVPAVTADDLWSLAVIVPAHDEELILAGTLTSLSAQHYPRECFEVVVVADNCTDGTAALARSHGVTVLERSHDGERGKGYALNYAISQLLQRPQPPSAFVIVDADTHVAPDFLTLISARLASCRDPRGFAAWQGRYGVLNVEDGWRAALMAGAFDLVNHVKPLGREALRLSVGLKGNGMAFTRALAAALPWPGGSLTEDLDYGLELARRFGLRVAYAPEARVMAQMPASAAQAASQRARWEGGRLGLIRDRAMPLLFEGIRTRSLLLLDAACDLLTPPLAELGALACLAIALVLGGVAAHLLPHPALWLGCALCCALGLPAYILGGLRLSGAPAEAYTALLRAPIYAVWKFVLLLSQVIRWRRGSNPEAWIRTERAPLTTDVHSVSSVPVTELPAE